MMCSESLLLLHAPSPPSCCEVHYGAGCQSTPHTIWIIQSVSSDREHLNLVVRILFHEGEKQNTTQAERLL